MDAIARAQFEQRRKFNFEPNWEKIINVLGDYFERYCSFRGVNELHLIL